jgi:hypothetical protein
MEGSYVYQPLSDPKSFRLIRLLPVADGDTIRVKLFEQHNDDYAPYEALSYEWRLPVSETSAYNEDVERLRAVRPGRFHVMVME